MVSAARRKIDSQTQQLFDPEVDKPEHDQVLTRLFGDNATLARIIMEAEGLKPLADFQASSMFGFSRSDGWAGREQPPVTLEQATRMTGVAPTWRSTSPIRLMHKSLELPLHYTTNGRGDSYRLIGFIDLAVTYDVVGTPSIAQDSQGVCSWVKNKERRHARFEVKGSWPTAGNLLRQLNLYALAWNSQLNGKPLNFVVGPDDSMSELVSQHGYRLVTFDRRAESFQLATKLETTAKAARVEACGVF